MKKKISFLDLVAHISRKDMSLAENEGRHIFTLLDPGNTGLIESAKLRRFGQSPPSLSRSLI
jgi:Ca2+-binding EF-hand superfamily protein